jgi:hypothetical protein
MTNTTKGNEMSERVTWVDYNWKGEVPGDTMAQVVILNDPDLYEKMSEDEDFDQRIWYYFQDEAEFQRAFDPDNTEQEFYIVREHTEIEGDKFE